MQPALATRANRTQAMKAFDLSKSNYLGSGERLPIIKLLSLEADGGQWFFDGYMSAKKSLSQR